MLSDFRPDPRTFHGSVIQMSVSDGLRNHRTTELQNYRTQDNSATGQQDNRTVCCRDMERYAENNLEVQTEITVNG